MSDKNIQQKSFTNVYFYLGFISILISAVVAFVLFGYFEVHLRFVDNTVNEQLVFEDISVKEVPLVTRSGFSLGEPSVFYAGAFKDENGFKTSGSAEIYVFQSERILRLQDFDTENGPDLDVLLVEARFRDQIDSALKQSKTIKLGDLKGNIGNQNYEIPSGLDLHTNRFVVIWSNRFEEVHGTAELVEDLPFAFE